MAISFRLTIAYVICVCNGALSDVSIRCGCGIAAGAVAFGSGLNGWGVGTLTTRTTAMKTD
jgi:hypothetical protein